MACPSGIGSVLQACDPQAPPISLYDRAACLRPLVTEYWQVLSICDVWQFNLPSLKCRRSEATGVSNRMLRRTVRILASFPIGQSDIDETEYSLGRPRLRRCGSLRGVGVTKDVSHLVRNDGHA
jgi:hypothetical protein